MTSPLLVYSIPISIIACRFRRDG